MMVVVKSARCACDDWYSTQARRCDARERESRVGWRVLSSLDGAAVGCGDVASSMCREGS